MAIGRHIYKVTRIVPVRFERSKSAPPAGGYAPDPDDRGFVGQDGPIVGVCRGDTAIIDVCRQMVDPAAPLYVTSADTAKLVIVSPAAGAVLPSGEHADVRFRAGMTDGDVKLQVRAQSATGPIVAELTVHVSSVITVHCAAHLTAIYAPPGPRSAANTTNRTRADVTAVMDEVNRQWRPAGVRFLVDTWRDGATAATTTNMTNQVPRNGVNPTDGILLCPIYGTGESNENFSRLMATNSVASRLNLYFVRGIQAADPAGNGPNYIGFGSSALHGLVMSDNIGDTETTAHTLSHELGHILTLAQMGHTNAFDSHSDDDPHFDADVRKRRHDLWTRRRLMYYMVGLDAGDRTGAADAARHLSAGRYAFDGTDVGYGNQRSGHLITINDLNQDPTDGEYTAARNQAATLP